MTNKDITYLTACASVRQSGLYNLQQLDVAGNSDSTYALSCSPVSSGFELLIRHLLMSKYILFPLVLFSLYLVL